MPKTFNILHLRDCNIPKLIVTITHNLFNVIIFESYITHKFANEVDELRALPGHMLGAARVQVPEYDLYDLKLTREEDGAVETLDPYFPDLLLLGCVCLAGVVDMDFLGDTSLVEMILVKGHVFPSIVKIRHVGFQLYPTLV
ncbi:hypothetical protein Tco_1076601 [Tanacetum coccineum]